MLRMALCDDEAAARDSLRFMLENIVEERTGQVVYEFSGGQSAVRFLEKHPGEIDVLFLDMEMPELNGMETARAIRAFDRSMFIVFVTGYADYVFEGYQVKAFDYLLKPVKASRLSKLLSRIIEEDSKREDSFFVFHNTDGDFRLPLADILYFYSVKRQAILVTEKKEYAFYEKLDVLERRLSEEGKKGQGADFVRIHQRYLVNAAKVTHLGKDFVTLAGRELPVSRSLKASVSEKFALSLLKGDILS